MSEYLVEVEHLKQYFQVRSGFKNMTLKAVDDVSFCIKPGEKAGYDQPIGISDYQLSKAVPENLKSALPSIEEVEEELTLFLDKDKNP